MSTARPASDPADEPASRRARPPATATGPQPVGSQPQRGRQPRNRTAAKRRVQRRKQRRGDRDHAERDGGHDRADVVPAPRARAEHRPGDRGQHAGQHQRQDDGQRRPTAVGTAPRRAPRAMSAPNATAMNSPGRVEQADDQQRARQPTAVKRQQAEQLRPQHGVTGQRALRDPAAHPEREHQREHVGGGRRIRVRHQPQPDRAEGRDEHQPGARSAAWPGWSAPAGS